MDTHRDRHPHRTRRIGWHPWGRCTVQPVTRALWSGRTLEVHAPGTTAGELLLLRTLQVWGVGGALVAVGAVLALHHAPAIGVGVGVLVYVAGFVLLARATRRVRPGVRTLTVTVFHGNGRPEVHGDVRLLEASLDLMCLAEAAVRRGRVSRVEYEHVWGQVWLAMPEPAVRAVGRSRSGAGAQRRGMHR
ncbi:hypothetical protein DEJ23_00955 [Curtobacterium sp. MCSS17_008]|uniref:DUF6611 family protein n=1 Tax=Curtobacterium sp. MCSS17_008 TaxID=2175647 RepID=UPI000DA754EC|nr:DUF6611 family protein [Curtobacterium sp. MCSS17_008]PZF59639.1 hypothetical protein DEJ23_00955 [Curtobacterium sp. MCSS17_008]